MTKEKEMDEFVATGRRKTAVASVRLRPGSGKVDINSRTMEDYFPSKFQRDEIAAPFVKLNTPNNYDMIIRVKGGGIQAQATAIRLGIARALVLEDDRRRPDMKEEGFLTRDARKKERKKYGKAGARRSFQFSKR